MLPLSSILAATPARIKRRARAQCFGKALVPKKRQGTATDGGGYLVVDEAQGGKYREFKYQIKCTDGWRKVATRFYGPLQTSTRVWCWCSCPYFKYHCEVALHKQGSSTVVQSNGQRPRFTNPSLSPRVCKHVYLLFALAIRSDVKKEHAEKKKVRDDKAQKKREAMKKSADKKRAEQKAKEKKRKQDQAKLKAAREEAQQEAKEKAAEAKAAREATKQAKAAPKETKQPTKQAGSKDTAKATAAKPVAKAPVAKAPAKPAGAKPLAVAPSRRWAGDKK